MKSIIGVTALVMLMCNASQSSAQPTRADYILKDCQETVHDFHEREAFNGVSPSGMLENYLLGHDKTGTFRANHSSYKVTLLENTSHGKLIENTSNAGIVSGIAHYIYNPKPAYLGKDKAVFMVEFEGKRYKVVLDIHVVRHINDSDEPTTSCPSPKFIKLHH